MSHPLTWTALHWRALLAIGLRKPAAPVPIPLPAPVMNHTLLRAAFLIDASLMSNLVLEATCDETANTERTYETYSSMQSSLLLRPPLHGLIRCAFHDEDPRCRCLMTDRLQLLIGG